MRKFALLILVFLIVQNSSAQKHKKPKLLAGPIVGTVTKTSAKIWIAYRGKGQNMLILGDTAEKKIYYPTNYSYITNAKGDIALTMDFTGLKPNHRYNILVSIDGWGSHVKYSFKTQADTTLKDFSFLTGSCALMNTDITRGIWPGGANWIFYWMRKRGGDFMVWLGDNVYYFYPWQSTNYDAMFDRQLKLRRSFRVIYRDFLGNQPNYAIWDGNDYGYNSPDKNFALKDSSLKVFKGFWPNKYPEQDKFKGNYFNFRYYDVEFFMMDDRYYRASKKDTAADFLGETQMIWLKNKLLMSDAAFKIICIGSGVINDTHIEDSYADYPKERNSLFDFIATNNIKGVIFLTGGKNYSEISKQDWKGYPLYEFSSSPLTTPPPPRWVFGAIHNQWRVKGTEYPFRSFGKIFVSGNKDNRKLQLVVYGRSGRKRHELYINEKELSRK